MYIMEYGGERLYDPRGSETLTSAQLDMEINASGTFEFTMQQGHPLFDKLEERRTDKPVKVYQDGNLLFYGDIVSIEADFYLGKKVTCRSDLAWLNDSIVKPYSTVEGEHGVAVPPTVDGYFEWLIDQHNNQVEQTKRFMVGKNEGSLLDRDNYVYRANVDRPTTGQEISEKILNSLGGYIVTRGEGPKRCVDLVTDFEKVNAQVIDFGVNLLDYVKTDQSEDMATFLVPLGAKLSETEYDYNDGYSKTSDTKPVANKEYYVRAFKKCGAMTAFTKDVTYYEKKKVEFKTSDTKPFSGVDYYLKKWKAQFNKSSIKKSFTKGKVYYEYTSAKGYFVTSDTKPQSGKTYYTQISKFSDGTTYYQYSSTDGYYKTSHTSPQKGVTYYTMSWEKQSITKFEDGKTYWEKETYYTQTGDSVPISGKEYYTLKRDSYTSKSDLGRFLKYETYYEYDENKDESDQKLSLDMLGKDYISGDYWRKGDAIYSDSAVEKYGWIGAVAEFENVTTLEELEEKGLATLKGMMQPVCTAELTAVDLALVKPDYEPIFIGQYIRGRSAPHDFDSYMLVSKVNLDLLQPEQNKYTLGNTLDVLTGVQNKRIKSLNATINQVYESAAAIGEEAKAAAKQSAEDAKLAQSNALDAATRAEQAAQEVENTKAQVEEVVEAADDALTAADEAQTKADQAVQDAYDAAVKAEEAKDAADEAAAQVELIQTDMTLVREAAQAAQDAAGAAESKANEAFAAVGQTQALVDTIESELDSVQQDAAKLRDDLEDQVKTVTDTMTAEYAKKTELTETAATLRTEIETSAAGIRQEVSSNYAKKTDLTSVQENLQTQVTQQAGLIEQKASKTEVQEITEAAKAEAIGKANEANAAAVEAQNKAQEAADNLATAESNLETLKGRVDVTEADIATAEAEVAKAKKAAQDAQADADAAVDAAQKAQNDVAGLTERVANAETAITQTSEAIKLTATKEELRGVSENATSASIAAAKAQADVDKIVNLIISTDKSTTFRSSSETVTATANVFYKGAKLSDEQVATLGTVRWYVNGTCVQEGGMTYSIKACNGTLKARLEV